MTWGENRLNERDEQSHDQLKLYGVQCPGNENRIGAYMKGRALRTSEEFVNGCAQFAKGRLWAPPAPCLSQTASDIIPAQATNVRFLAAERHTVRHTGPSTCMEDHDAF